MTENEIGKIVVDAAVSVHRDLGPGLLETVYEVALAHVLRQRGLGGVVSPSSATTPPGQ